MVYKTNGYIRPQNVTIIIKANIEIKRRVETVTKGKLA